MSPERNPRLMGVAHAMDDWAAGNKAMWAEFPAAWKVMPEAYKEAYTEEWDRQAQEAKVTKPEKKIWE